MNVRFSSIRNFASAPYQAYFVLCTGAQDACARLFPARLVPWGKALVISPVLFGARIVLHFSGLRVDDEGDIFERVTFKHIFAA